MAPHCWLRALKLTELFSYASAFLKRHCTLASGKLNAIPAALLRQVQSLVGPAKEVCKLLRFCLLGSGNPETRCHVHGNTGEIEVFRLNFRAEPFQCSASTVSIDLRKNDNKLFAPKSTAKIRKSGIRFDYLGNSLEHQIARFMAVVVIDNLEIVSIGNCDPHRKAVPGGPTKLPDRPFLYSASIR
jgi:hypothetical protein